MELIRFAAELAEAAGGVAERRPDGGAHLLLPDEMAREVSLPAEVHLVEDAGAGDGGDGGGPLRLTHGSETLERLLGAAIGDGRLAAVEIGASPATISRAQRVVEKTLRPVNGTIRMLAAELATSSYLALGFHYDAVGEERREGLVDVAVDLSGRFLAPLLSQRLWSSGVPMHEIALPPGGISAEGALRTAAALARVEVLDALGPVHRLLSNRLQRDVERLHGYMRSMQLELLRTGAPRARGDAGVGKLLQRINALPDELERRITEARSRLSLRVAMRPVTAVLVQMPAVAVRVRLLRRKAQRELVLTCGALHRGVDLPTCEACHGRVVGQPSLCDERVHLLCPDCLWTCTGCGAIVCFACHRRCRRCGHRPATAPGSCVPGAARQRTTTAATAQEATPVAATPKVAPLETTAPKAVTPRTADRRKAGAARHGEACGAQPSKRRARERPRAPRPSVDPGAEALRALQEMAQQLGGLAPAGSARDRVREVLGTLGEASTAEVARHAGLSLDHVRKALRDLRRAGVVDFAGHGRGTRYHLV